VKIVVTGPKRTSVLSKLLPMVFESSAHLTGAALATAPQVFEYDSVGEELVRVSDGEPGFTEGENSADSSPATISVQEFSSFGFQPAGSQTHLALSDDGGTVMFSSNGALTPGAVIASRSGAESVYEYRTSGRIRDGRVHLLSSGVNESTPVGDGLGGLTHSAADAFLLESEPLVPFDTDRQIDLYDAREGGGFEAPHEPISCLATQSCRQSSSPPESVPAPLTPVFVGPPNPAPKPHKKRKKPKRKGRANKHHSHSRISSSGVRKGDRK
jgi:hypothetical protein